MTRFDVTVIGAGGAGLFCAGLAGRSGLSVLLIDHAAKVAEKIRISGGGRCNFTNREVGPQHFLSENPHFCRSALAGYTPEDFIALLSRHGIGWHEKHKGQLFCDGSSEQIIRMLQGECERGAVTHWQPCAVHAVRRADGGFELDTDRGPARTRRLVVATGGLSIPKIGASDFGYRLARQFGHSIVPTRPALVPLTFDAWAFAPLAGVSLPVCVQGGSAPRAEFADDLLFTHRGLSGPAILQISSYLRPGEPLAIDLAPGIDLEMELRNAKRHAQRQLVNQLAAMLPSRLAHTWLAGQSGLATRPLPEVRDSELRAVAQSLHRWHVAPSGSEGYRKAEVTAGGVETRELSSRTMESGLCPGLYFIGEVVDVTGWLGGYNFQWAWASAAACARHVVS